MGSIEQAIYGGIALHAELETGEARPSAATLAGYAICCERTVFRALTDLETWRYIDIERRPGKASIYRLLPPPPLPALGSATPDTDAGVERATHDTSTPAPLTQDPRTPDTSDIRTRTKNENQELELRTSTDVDTFESFWASYPKRNGKRLEKAKARRAWERLSPQERRLAESGVTHYAAACDSGATIAKDAFRWVRGRSFVDWQTPARPQLRAVGGHQPYANPDDAEYEGGIQ